MAEKERMLVVRAAPSGYWWVMRGDEWVAGPYATRRDARRAAVWLPLMQGKALVRQHGPTDDEGAEDERRA